MYEIAIPYGDHKKIASKIGVTPSHLCAIFRGRVVPGAGVAERLERWSGIPMLAWRNRMVTVTSSRKSCKQCPKNYQSSFTPAALEGVPQEVVDLAIPVARIILQMRSEGAL